MPKAIDLGPVRGLYQPDYELHFYRDGDPRRPLDAQLNLGSVVSISTSKSITDLAGTWSIVIKDGRARHVLREMDTVRIRLRGHGDARLVTVLKGVVDEVRAAGEADVGASREDTVITGRCLAKYLQVTSLFLPVWDPASFLPTALIFGLGDVTGKGLNPKVVGQSRPYDIFRYIIRKYTYGEKGIAGVSGIPNSRYWLDHQTRFARSSVDFQVPFLQFDEDTVGDALKRLEVLGFTEAWVDELGRIVYRHPGWDRPVTYRLSTDDLVDWDLNRTDVDTSTYVEVIPAGDPGIDSGTAQALRAGRAPVPSSYLSAAQDAGLSQTVTPEFVIETDKNGVVTAAGQTNHWYKLQRRLGVRPQQITSPLLASQEQAQAQAEGLLRFLTRMQKGGTLTLPGAPEVRLGHTLLLHGELDGVRIKRTYYIEAVQHSMVWGESYTTTVTVSHGRDPWDPAWQQIALPKVDPAALASGDGGVLDPGTGQNPADTTTDAVGNVAALSIPANAPKAVRSLYQECNRMAKLGVGYQWGGGHGAYTPAGPWDCSGAVSQALHKAGLLTGGALVSGQLASWGVSGQGAFFTVEANSIHTFIRFPGGLCWGTTSAGKGGGVAFHHHPTAGFAARHWPTL